MRARAARGGEGRAAWIAGSALVHAAVLGAVFWLAGRATPPVPVEQGVSLVWDSGTAGAGDAADSAAAPAPPAAPPAPPPSPAAPPALPEAMAAAPPPPAPPVEAPPPPPPAAMAEAPPPPPPPPQAEAPPAPPPPAMAASPPPPPEPVREPPRPPRQQAAAPPAPRPVPPAEPAAPTVWTPPQRPGPAAAGAALAAGPATAEGAVVPPRPAGEARNPSPEYPQASRVRGEQGRVTLLVQVDPAGQVLDLSVLGSSGHAALDGAALRAVRRWRFEPARQNGMAVFATVTVGITFRLDGGR